jgi:hypothetical protein
VEKQANKNVLINQTNSAKINGDLSKKCHFRMDPQKLVNFEFFRFLDEVKQKMVSMER